MVLIFLSATLFAQPTSPEKPPGSSEGDRSTLRDLGQIEPPAEPAVDTSPPSRRRAQEKDEMPFGHHRVPPGGRVRDVVSVLGATTVAGEADSDAVSVLGDTHVTETGRVGGDAVAVLGRLESAGQIGRDAVSVLGGLTINGPVGGTAVSVLGNMDLGPKAEIDGDVVIVFGTLTKAPGAVVRGDELGLPTFGGFGQMEWFTTWVRECVFYGRPLAFKPNLGWAWIIALSFLGFYLLVALVAPRGLLRCVETLETRPGYSILTSVLTVFLTPVAIVLLAVTLVGALFVPFLVMALFLGSLFGKAVMLAWIGRRFTRFFGDGPLGHPVFAVLVGGLLVLLIYTLPVVGFLTFKLLSWLGLGVVVYSIALATKRERPPERPLPAGASLPPVAPVPAGVPAAVSPSAVAWPPPPAAGFVEPVVRADSVDTPPGVSEPPAASDTEPSPLPSVATEQTPAESPSETASVPPLAATPPPIPGPPPVRPTLPPPAVAYPRAGFFLRLGALALDGILVGLILAFVSGLLPRVLEFDSGPGGWLLALAIYGAIMWKLKGTTIGGIVCSLKVVRLDQREIDWPTAVVRALACFLSLAVAGLGFIWIAFDDDKQSWHDKIAGTAVVVVPKGTPLV